MTNILVISIITLLSIALILSLINIKQQTKNKARHIQQREGRPANAVMCPKCGNFGIGSGRAGKVCNSLHINEFSPCDGILVEFNDINLAEYKAKERR